MPKYVSYIRVSTQKQEKSGLSFEAQIGIIEHFAKLDQAKIVQVYIEIESGKEVENRPKLQEAIQFCLSHDATLIVAKLDRLSRDVEHVFKIKRILGNRLKSCDLPDTDTMTLGIFASLAQRERELISIRTKIALKAKKARGASLGKSENFQHKHRKAGGEARKLKAQKDPNNQRAAAFIKICKEQNMSLANIANLLNQNGFRTSTNKKFHKTSVKRLLVRITNLAF